MSVRDLHESSSGHVSIRDNEYELLRALVRRCTGIDLGARKHHLVEARLGRRLRRLGLTSYAEYLEFVAGSRYDPAELRRFIDAITTNETSFFREAHHVEYLAREWFPALRQESRPGEARKLRIWSACCSSGEEPYTIGMSLLEALRDEPRWSARILASDINTEVLERAAQGIYSLQRVQPVPPELLRRYFQRISDDGDAAAQVRPELRQMIVFREVNLIDATWPVRPGLDAIFCRNALIYFDQPTRQAILERFAALLRPNGILVLGHSETIHGIVGDLEHLKNTIYRRRSS